MSISIIKKIKLRTLLFLRKKGWQYHPKETYAFQGKNILATKGAFFRNNEKDDAWLYLLSRHHDFIVDVGCNIGQSSLLMTLGTNNKILCIDPNPSALSKCAENLIFNGLSHQSIFVNAFISDNDGSEIDFFTFGDGAAGSMFAGFAKTATAMKQSVKIRSRTIDSICFESSFSPDLIKIDVEGAEKFVLKGIGPVALLNKPDIFVEVHSGKELSIIDNTTAVMEWCYANDYEPYYLKTHTMLNSVEEIKSRGRYHLLLLSKSKSYPEYLKGVPENAPLENIFSNG
jgi:FkbM family methyltransferase